MRCPECGIEMRVENRSREKNGLRLTFACRNRHCSRFEKIMAEKRLT